jgi:ribosome-associated toxin RatA of RatAB toxin-antitoxin module
VCACVRMRAHAHACLLYLQPSAESNKEVQKLFRVLCNTFSAHFIHLVSTNSQIASQSFLSAFKLLNFTWILFLHMQNLCRFLGVHFDFYCTLVGKITRCEIQETLGGHSAGP